MNTRYDAASLKAEEFINHEEILRTLSHSKAHGGDRKILLEILKKASEKKGLSYSEASLLLETEDPEILEEMFKIAASIKEDIYGPRIVLFAPLYLSNYCVNGCTYCPYHLQNKHIARRKLTMDEIRDEVVALQDMGHKRLALELGEDPINNPMEYVLEAIETIYSINHDNGAIRRVNVNIAATTVENYKRLKEADIGTYICFRRPIIKRAMKSFIPQVPSITMPTIQKLMTEPWKLALTMWDWGFSLGLRLTAMSWWVFSCTQSTWRPALEWVPIPLVFLA